MALCGVDFDSKTYGPLHNVAAHSGAVVSICVQYAGTHENDDGKAGRLTLCAWRQRQRRSESSRWARTDV